MGTPGHMAHPFDVDKVKTGQDLIDYVQDAVLRLQNQEIAGSLKWDGINTSFKLITTDDGRKEFRMDRGTSEIGSVIGFNAASALEKWGTEHGMTQAIVKLLKIFDKALPLIKSELKELGMWDDSTKYFNTEYIEGKSNVQEYEDNILAIHGINQFYEKKAQEWRKREGTSMDRPGLERPIDPRTDKPALGTGIEIPYNKEALASLIEKVGPIAADYGFEVYGDVPVEFDPDVELDLEKVLDTPVAIQVVPGGVEEAPLREWLKGAEHPRARKITKADGKSVGALSKDIYMAVLRSAEEGGIPLSEYLESKEDVKDAINGGIFYHGTRLLGQAVKSALTSAAGNVGKHEGVVLRGMEDFLVKLTGDFIIQGLASTHGDRGSMLGEGMVKKGVYKVIKAATPGWLHPYALRALSPLQETDTEKQRIAIYPGRFQPMGPHHFQTFQKIADEYGIDNTFIATSDVVNPPGSPLNFEQKKSIMVKHGIPESQIVHTRNPYAATEILSEFDPSSTVVTYLVGAKDMAENPRFSNLDGALKDGTPAHLRSLKADEEQLGFDEHSYVGVAPHISLNVPGGGEMCGTSLRQCLQYAAPEEFEKIMGWFDQETYDMLRDTLQEISAMGAGSVQGGMIGTGSKKGPWHDLDTAAFNKRQKENAKLRGAKEFIAEEELVSEVMDYLIGITVG